MIGHLIGGIISLSWEVSENRGSPHPIALFLRYPFAPAEVLSHLAPVLGRLGKALLHTLGQTSYGLLRAALDSRQFLYSTRQIE
jgi:hypothetical protein